MKYAIFAILLFGCDHHTRVLSPEAEKVQVGRGGPTDNFELIGPVTAKDGSGCGLYGATGTYNHAVTNLRAQAGDMGADYVAITTVNEPHSEPNCRVNTYVITGNAYKKVAETQSAIPVHVQVQNAAEPPPDVVEKLRQLEQLHRSGALTDDEFSRAKARILQAPATN